MFSVWVFWWSGRIILMSDPESYRPAQKTIPTAPGVYRFIDELGRVIYVGKAKNLRNRLNSYFRAPDKLHPRTLKMVHTAAAVKWVVVANELEALTLEYTWIKEFSPRFNVIFRDDKSYPYLAVTTSQEYPRTYITRARHRKGNRYFGPYPQVWAIRESLDALTRVFPVRTCTQGVFNRATAQGRPCLQGYIERCCAPCVGWASAEEHRTYVERLLSFMNGGEKHLIGDLKRNMERAAAELDFEQAAKYRDKLNALTKVRASNAVVFADGSDADIFALASNELSAAVHVFFVRGGRVRGNRSWVVEDRSLDDPADFISDLLMQVYGDREPGQTAAEKRTPSRSVDDRGHRGTDAVPRTVLVPQLPTDLKTLQEWLADKRGGPVEIKVPQRGEKKQIMQTVTANAEQALKLFRMQRISDLAGRGAALAQLRDELNLPRSPLRMECFDISHTSGTNMVASMVVFEDGLPAKREYRKFTVKSPNADDTEAMSEVLHRRFAKTINEDSDTGDPVSGQLNHGDGKPRKFSYLPDLLVVDGGLPQVNAAQSVLDDIGIDLPVIGLAKRLEEIWLPGSEFPVILSRDSVGLYILQYLRDEAHRFAIWAHRRKRAKSMTESVLDAIPGVGPQKQKALLKTYKSVKRLTAASVADLTEVPGIGPLLAAQIYDALHPDSSE